MYQSVAYSVDTDKAGDMWGSHVPVTALMKCLLCGGHVNFIVDPSELRMWLLSTGWKPTPLLSRFLADLVFLLDFPYGPSSLWVADSLSELETPAVGPCTKMQRQKSHSRDWPPLPAQFSASQLGGRGRMEPLYLVFGCDLFHSRSFLGTS